VVALPNRRSAVFSQERTAPASFGGEAMKRKLVWREERSVWLLGCSECDWVFNPSGFPTGSTIEEMMHNYEQQSDKDFAAHVCSEYPRGKNMKG
jgi:hypothetical protein